MNTKNIVLFGVGFFVGYLIVNNRRSKNYLVSDTTTDASMSETIPSGETAGTSIVSEEVAIEDPKITICKEKWVKFAETRRFSSPEQAQSTYDNFMTSCVAQS